MRREKKKKNLARHCHLNLNCVLVRRLPDNFTSLLCAEKKKKSGKTLSVIQTIYKGGRSDAFLNIHI